VGGNAIAVAGPYVAGDYINAAHAVPPLAGRVPLAPPRLGDWGLIGREEDLRRLDAHLKQHGQAAVTAISGLGGLGKTALALGYLAVYGELYELVAWIDAERPDLIAEQYRALVRNRTGRDLPEGDAVVATKVLLAGSEGWLVIFDNATTPEDLQPYLPAGSGRVLVTTRNQAWSANPELVFELNTLPGAVVAAWLSKALPGSGAVADSAIEDLAGRLGGLPLAVVQALAYIRARPGETAASYLARFATKDGQREALGRRPPDYPRPVATTWDLATEALATEAPAAVELLRYLAYLSPDGVALHLLDDLGEPGGLSASLEALGRYGLVRASSTRVSVHPLVQDVTRWRLSPEDEARCIEALAAHLASAAPDPWDHATWAWFRDIAPHVLSLTDHAATLQIDPPDLANLANQTGISLVEQVSPITGLSILDRALRIFEAAYGPDHPLVASTLVNLGNARRGLGECALAVEVYDRALRIFEAAYGPDQPQVAATLGNLGVAHQALGDPALAVELHDRALRIFEAAYGPDHPLVARTLVNLGIARQDLDEYALAVELHDRALRIFEAAYGPDHPLVAITLDNLGSTRRNLDEYALAVELYDRALRIFEATYGPDHPQVAITLIRLGIARESLREPALEVYERALRIFEAASGPDHPNLKALRRLLYAAPHRRRRRLRQRLRPRS
jgi:tetratricopeptide (TPR) repeat protein